MGSSPAWQRIELNASQDIDPVAVVPELHLKLQLAKEPNAVSVLPATARVKYDWSDGAIDLEISNVDYHTVVQMEIDGYQQLQGAQHRETACP